MLIERNHVCLHFHSFGELVAAQDQAMKCDVAILDIDLGRGQPSGIDAYEWLMDNGFDGHVNFLTAHGRGHPLVKNIRERPEVALLSKPVVPGVLLDLIQSGY